MKRAWTIEIQSGTASPLDNSTDETILSLCLLYCSFHDAPSANIHSHLHLFHKSHCISYSTVDIKKKKKFIRTLIFITFLYFNIHIDRNVSFNDVSGVSHYLDTRLPLGFLHDN